MGGLAVAALFAGRWLKPLSGATRSLPIEALELLGRRTIEPKVSIHMVRCGAKILVIGVTPEGVQSLSEIVDPIEVDRLTEICHQQSDSRQSDNPIRRKETAASRGDNHRDGVMTRLSMMLLCAALWHLGGAEACAQGPRPERQFDSVSQRRSEERPYVSNPSSDPTGLNHGDIRKSSPRAATVPNAVQPAVFEGDAFTQDNTAPNVVPQQNDEHSKSGLLDPSTFATPGSIGASMKWVALMTVVGLVPTILLMSTCFVRFSIVLGLLRQAIGTQQAPPNQVVTALSLFMTCLVMAPVWQRCYDDGLRPYSQPRPGEIKLDEVTAFHRTVAPLRQFMSLQIDRAGNADAIWMLLDYQRPSEDSVDFGRWIEPQSYHDVPLTVLAPAYLLSELKVAFLIGFQIFLPFLVVDLVVASVLTSLGLTMMPPSLVSLPFKMLLFVLIDGWFLTVGMLLESVQTI